MASTQVSAALVHVDFDTAPVAVPQNFYAGVGLTVGLSNGQPGPAGGGEVTSLVTPPGLPAPAAGRGLRPYTNLAGFLGAFELGLSTPADMVQMWAFDGPQGFTVQGYRLGQLRTTLQFPAESGRTSQMFVLGTVGGPQLYDRVIILPTPGNILDPAAGPTYFDELTFNTVPAPGGGAILVAGLVPMRRRRKA